MFDLFRSRDKAVRYLLGGLLTLVALSMVTYLIPGYGTNYGTDTNMVLATVGGEKITAAEAQQIFQKSTSGRIPNEMLEIYFPQFLENMVREKAAIYIAKDMGLIVS